MPEQLLMQMQCSAAAVAAAALLAWGLNGPLAAGLAVGGAWGFANLWCLTQLLAAWLSPMRSRRRVIGWLVIKLAVLYPLAVAVLQAYPHLSMGFGIGFTVVLVIVMGGFARQARCAPQIQQHGR